MITHLLPFASLYFALLGQTPLLNENLLLGAPSVEVSGRTQLLVKKGFVVMHDNINKGPLWVTFLLKKEYVSTNAREGSFKPDDALLMGQRSELDDYSRSGYDRGHMAASADMRRTPEIQAESFLLSNMWPQNPILNRQAWAKLEDTMRGYAVQFKTVQIYVGPVYTKIWPAPYPDSLKPIGIDQVTVPSGFYRIIVRKLPTGKYAALAFEFPNAPFTKQVNLANFLVSVRQVEKDTQLDFCSALPRKVQDQFEKVKPKKLW